MLRSRFKLAAWDGVSFALESSAGMGGVCNGRASSAWQTSVGVGHKLAMVISGVIGRVISGVIGRVISGVSIGRVISGLVHQRGHQSSYLADELL